MASVALMPWVRFVKPFDYFVKPKVVFAYKPNREYLVKQACATEAVRKGSAVLVERPQKERDANKNHIDSGKTKFRQSTI